MKERKARERTEARARRKAIPLAARVEKSARICARVLALPEVMAARVVGCYVSVHSEVDTRPLFESLLLAGRRVAVPVVEPPERMELARIHGVGDLIVGAHDIPEPGPPHALVDLAEVDVVLVPGLQFTSDGHRLGNGGGYFDRLLTSAPHARRVGLGFEEQVAPEVPHETHDVMLDALVTDARLRRFVRQAGHP